MTIKWNRLSQDCFSLNKKIRQILFLLYVLFLALDCALPFDLFIERKGYINVICIIKKVQYIQNISLNMERTTIRSIEDENPYK